jgi:hypothetical protein
VIQALWLARSRAACRSWFERPRRHLCPREGPAEESGDAGRHLSTLAPLRALRARTSDLAWPQRAVGGGVKSCPRAG